MALGMRESSLPKRPARCLRKDLRLKAETDVMWRLYGFQKRRHGTPLLTYVPSRCK